MLQDTLDMALHLAGITPFIFYQGGADAAGFFAAAAPGIAAEPQQGRDLGERMKRAFAAIAARGFREIAIIGTDSPDLPAEYVFAAFTQLEDEHTDVVFGPAADGGYYLLAMKRVWDELFHGYSLEQCRGACRQRCKGKGFTPGGGAAAAVV